MNYLPLEKGGALHFSKQAFVKFPKTMSVFGNFTKACLFCLYTTIKAQVVTCMLTIHDCITLKLDIT